VAAVKSAEALSFKRHTYHVLCVQLSKMMNAAGHKVLEEQARGMWRRKRQHRTSRQGGQEALKPVCQSSCSF
jgi:hypothetical protein